MLSKKIAAVSMVKDECDIIELFIRINARVVDRFYILDNNSSDATRAIPGGLAMAGALTMGNHRFIMESDKGRPSVPLGLRLAHVPIRSSDQLVSKVIVGSHQYSIKQNRKEHTGFHWDLIAGVARRNNYALDYPTLRRTL